MDYLMGIDLGSTSIMMDDEGNKTYREDGKRYLAFKTGTTFTDGKPKKVRTYNAKAKLVDLGEVNIGNGSIGQVAGAMGIYTNTTPDGKKIIDAGVTLYLDSIKINKLVKYDGPDSGFEADDDLEDDAFLGVDEEFDSVDEEEAGAATPRL